MTVEEELGRLWGELTRLSDRISRRGFDYERTLISARHEIRGLASHALDEDGHYLVVAGDKRGAWYAAEFGFDDPEYTVSPFVELPAPAGNTRVIDDILVAPWGEGGKQGVVLATRGNGAWVTPLDRILDTLFGGQPALSAGESIQLPGSEERQINRLVFDPPSRTLLAVARHEYRNEFLVWSLAQSQPELVSREELPYAVTALAVDRADEGSEGDQLYVATELFEMYCFTRPGRGRKFRVTAETIEAKRDADRRGTEPMPWQGRLSPILQMRPLSDIGHRDPRSGEWRRTYPHRGVFAITLRHLLLLYDTPEEPGAVRCHARLVVDHKDNLSLTILNLPETEEDCDRYAGWHGVAVSTLRGHVRIFRPSGVRRPESGGFGLFRRDAAEMKSPTSLISGYKDLQADIVPDRVYAMQALCPLGGQGQELPVIFGLGNNEVRWHRFRLRWRLRQESREVAQQLVRSTESIEELLIFLQNITLHSVFWKEGQEEAVREHAPDPEIDPRRDKNTLIEVIPRLAHRCESEEHWRNFYLMVWDALARRAPSYIAVGMIQALRRVQLKLPDRMHGEELLRRQGEIEDEITRIRKFVLDPGNFSKKRTGYLELTGSEDPALADERVIYRSILMARRHDPVFLTDFEPLETGLLGEVLTFTPLPSSAGQGEFWDVEEPGRMRFVASNYYGDLWLLDGEGRAECLLEETDFLDDLGHIRAVHVHGDDLLLSFSQGRLRRLDWRQLTATAEIGDSGLLLPQLLDGIDDRNVNMAAFASEPSSGGGSAPRLLWGDLSGRIFLYGRQDPLFEQEADSSQLGVRAICQLEWFETHWGKESRLFVLAATETGLLLLFRWHEDAGPSLDLLSEMQIGSSTIAALLVTGPNNRDIVVARYDTAVGLRLLGSPDGPRLGTTWAFRTGDTVRSIQPIRPANASDIAGEARVYRVLVGSHDAHLYALDLDGRLLEACSFRQDPLRREAREDEGFKLGLFVTAPPREEDGEYVFLRIYACAFENRYLGLRLIDRPKMLREFQRKLDACPPREKEVLLTRWRAYHVDEGHLRHRFIRQSRRYPGEEPRFVIEAIDRLLEAGDPSVAAERFSVRNVARGGAEPTGEMTALLRRLFLTQHLGPGEEPDVSQGLPALLAKPELYHGAITVLHQCEKRWDTPNSIANRRVQLFWVRSLLREIQDLATLRLWLEVGKTLASRVPLARPEALLRHFLEHLHRLVQYKTLQYLERLLFGWPGLRAEPLFERGKATRDDLEWFLNGLFSRLALRPKEVSRGEASPVVLRIGRLLCLMVREHYTDPLFLTYLIQRHSIGHDMYHILEDQWEAMGDLKHNGPRADSRDPDPARVFRLARRLDQGLAGEKPLANILGNLRNLIDRPWIPSDGPDADYLKEAPIYFRTLLPLLEVEYLQDLQHLAEGSGWRPPPPRKNFRYCPSYSLLAELEPLLKAVRNYYEKKYEDQWVSPVLTHLRFADFDDMRREWRLWREKVKQLLRANPPALARSERHLLECVIASWQEILISEEQNTHLLQDFQFTVRQHLFTEIGQSDRFDPEMVARVREEKELAFRAFTNLFTRLLLLTEPREAAFLYRQTDEDEEIRGLWFHDVDSTAPELLRLHLGDPLPDWMSPSWLVPGSFIQLDAARIKDELRSRRSDRLWSVDQIAGTPDERGVLAYYIFAWGKEHLEGYERLLSQSLAWQVPLQALVYRRAAVEQVEFKGRIFSIIAHNLGAPVYLLRSDLRLLADGFLERRQDLRLNKYRQLLRQARHMDGIIDSILSLSDRKITLQLNEVSLAQLGYEVVRTVRREAKGRNIGIEYPKPSEQARERTRLCTDETKVYDILLMLLNNAVKYSPPGGRVFVTLSMKRAGAEFRVRDQGPGIPKDERDRIYQPFYRGAVSQKTASGLGLGLYTANLYAMLLGGRLSHQNEDDGLTFGLFVPGSEPGGN